MDPEHQPTHFMHGTVAEIWGTDTHEIMYTTAADWDTDWMEKYLLSYLFFVC